MAEMSRSIRLLVGAYFLVGFLYAAWLYSLDLRTFVCEEPDAPHGYVTIWSDSYRNPGPETCARRGFSLASIVSVPIMTIVGVPVMIVRGLPRQY